MLKKLWINLVKHTYLVLHNIILIQRYLIPPQKRAHSLTARIFVISSGTCLLNRPPPALLSSNPGHDSHKNFHNSLAIVLASSLTRLGLEAPPPVENPLNGEGACLAHSCALSHGLLCPLVGLACSENSAIGHASGRNIIRPTCRPPPAPHEIARGRFPVVLISRSASFQ